jgi:uncharacterized membrane protein
MEDTFTPDAAAAAAATAAAGSALAIGAGLLIFFWILGIAGFILFLWALIDVIRRQFTNPNDKVLWIVLIIFIGVIGPLLYLIIGRKKGTIPGAPKATV